MRSNILPCIKCWNFAASFASGRENEGTVKLLAKKSFQRCHIESYIRSTLKLIIGHTHHDKLQVSIDVSPSSGNLVQNSKTKDDVMWFFRVQLFLEFQYISNCHLFMYMICSFWLILQSVFAAPCVLEVLKILFIKFLASMSCCWEIPSSLSPFHCSSIFFLLCH